MYFRIATEHFAWTKMQFMVLNHAKFESKNARVFVPEQRMGVRLISTNVFRIGWNLAYSYSYSYMSMEFRERDNVQ